MINNLIKKITKTGHNKLCIMVYALCIAFTACANPDAGINTPYFFTDVKAVSARPYHTVAIKEGGALWAWGYNNNGQLGDGTTDNSSFPVQVMSDVKAVSAGYLHTVALKEDGTVWAWGSNQFGQLGDGNGGTTGDYESSPVQVKNSDNTPFTDVIAVSAGYYYTVAIKNDNTVWAWGYNYEGQLGDGTSGSGTNKSYPVQVISAPSTPFTDVIAVSAGQSHTVAIKKGGALWAWGNNTNGQLGDGTSGSGTDKIYPVQVMSNASTEFTDVIAVSAGESHTVALKKDGALWAWGQNTNGQLGDGTSGSGTNKSYPIKVGDGWAEVSAGAAHTVAIKRDRILWAWGSNGFGQLGDGSATDRYVPRRVMMSEW